MPITTNRRLILGLTSLACLLSLVQSISARGIVDATSERGNTAAIANFHAADITPPQDSWVSWFGAKLSEAEGVLMGTPQEVDVNAVPATDDNLIASANDKLIISPNSVGSLTPGDKISGNPDTSAEVLNLLGPHFQKHSRTRSGATKTSSIDQLEEGAKLGAGSGRVVFDNGTMRAGTLFTPVVAWFKNYAHRSRSENSTVYNAPSNGNSYEYPYTNLTVRDRSRALLVPSPHLSLVPAIGSSDRFAQLVDRINMIRFLFNCEAIPTELILAIMKQESGFNPFAISRAGAKGIMQLTDATARHEGVSDSFDEFQNTVGGIKYFEEQLERFHRDFILAIAAYNTGPGDIHSPRGSKSYYIASCYEMGVIPNFIETRDYVPAVLRIAGISMDLGSYMQKPRGTI